MTNEEFLKKAEEEYPQLLAGARREWHPEKLRAYIARQANFRRIEDDEDESEALKDLWRHIENMAISQI